MTSKRKGAPGPAIFLHNLALSQEGLNDDQRDLLKAAAKMLCDFAAEIEQLQNAKEALKDLASRANAHVSNLCN